MRLAQLNFIVQAAVTVVAGTWLRLSHSELTETQLLIEYWWYWLGSTIALIASAAWAMRDNRGSHR